VGDARAHRARQDDHQRCKNPSAARSKLVAGAGFSLWLSATAGQNPLKRSYLAPLLAQVTGARAKDLKDFEQWCLDQQLGVIRDGFGKWEWRCNPADCEKVRALLFDPGPARTVAGIRRRPEDLVGWLDLCQRHGRGEDRARGRRPHPVDEGDDRRRRRDPAQDRAPVARLIDIASIASPVTRRRRGRPRRHPPPRRL
jgi:hypothetical protein